MGKLFNCKTCGNEMAKSAKTCPNCGAKNKTPFYKKWWVWVITVVVVVVAATSGNTGSENNSGNTSAPQKNSPKISMEEFEKIKTGMSYEEVVSIIGGEGELTSQVDIAGYDTKMYTWQGEGGLGANANATFQNGALTSKAQLGLK